MFDTYPDIVHKNTKTNDSRVCDMACYKISCWNNAFRVSQRKYPLGEFIKYVRMRCINVLRKSTYAIPAHEMHWGPEKIDVRKKIAYSEMRFEEI